MYQKENSPREEEESEEARLEYDTIQCQVQNGQVNGTDRYEEYLCGWGLIHWYEEEREREMAKGHKKISQK
jgi:hypothetical protein